MDPLTHTLTGLALSRTGLKRWSSHGTSVVLLAANAPDFDLVTMAGGQTAYLHYHRHITHSLFAIPLVALLPLLIVRLFARKPFDWKRAYVVSLIGVATHPLLDFMNTYGVRWFLPFSGRWMHADLFNLVDAWIWAVLFLAAAAPFVSRLVSTEIGARPGSGRGWAIFALAFIALWGGGRWVLHQRALALLEARLYQSRPPLRVAALPGAFNPFGWRGLVETEQAWFLEPVNLLREFDPGEGRLFYKPQLTAAEQAAARHARQTEPFRVFLNFSLDPFWRFEPAAQPERAIRVEAMDLRFGTPAVPRFVAAAVVGPDGQVIEARFDYEPRR